MPMTEMVVMVAVTAAVVLAFINVLRLVGTLLLHKTVRRAVERDPASADRLIAHLGESSAAASDDRLSTILIAVGIAMIAASVVIGDVRWLHYGIAAALFPLVVGTALWLRLLVQRRASQRAAGE